ncbi:hypothetical protein [Streptomyces nymphaeiformis]|uniref:Uncharacterized protein n=1 Tax=Streptomyces nymphaeiformis TaxID=2663842 RepID=A0A7W7TUS5_9ACTN|nr:hypothetical protein [Streptomyces nymphaeiformis]MBB4979733.1 hypothetical protein [Streptomyces nymphaeiformis]
MKRRRKHWRDGFGTPKFFVLYRTPDVWRYAMYFSGAIVDGYLAQPSADSEPGEAQTAAHGKAEDLAGRPLTMSWEASDEPGWWTGTITTEPMDLALNSAAG